MRWTQWTAALALLALVALCAPLYAQTKPVNDGDQTLRALRDEMARSKTRLELKIPGTAAPVRPFYVAYRLLDLDIKTVSAEFGALVSSTTTRNRFMATVICLTPCRIWRSRRRFPRPTAR